MCILVTDATHNNTNRVAQPFHIHSNIFAILQSRVRNDVLVVINEYCRRLVHFSANFTVDIS